MNKYRINIVKFAIIQYTRMIILSIMLFCNISYLKSQCNKLSSFEIQNWNINKKLNLPDSLRNKNIEGSVILKYYFSTKTFSPIRLEIIRFKLINITTKKSIYAYNQLSSIKYLKNQYPAILQRFYPFFMEYVKSLRIIKTDSSYNKAASYIILSRRFH